VCACPIWQKSGSAHSIKRRLAVAIATGTPPSSATSLGEPQIMIFGTRECQSKIKYQRATCAVLNLLARGQSGQIHSDTCLSFSFSPQSQLTRIRLFLFFHRAPVIMEPFIIHHAPVPREENTAFQTRAISPPRADQSRISVFVVLFLAI